MLPVLIGKIGLPILISVIGTALGKIDNPVAQSAAESLQNFQGALAGGAISIEQMAEANRHAESLAALKSKEYETALSEINQSLRAEVGSSDPYVRRMRPTFGYLLAFTWALQMVGVAYIIVFDTDKIGAVLNGMEGLSAIWAVALSVLGIYVYKRSEEKKVYAPYPAAAAEPKKTVLSVTKTTNVTPSSANPTYND